MSHLRLAAFVVSVLGVLGVVSYVSDKMMGAAEIETKLRGRLKEKALVGGDEKIVFDVIKAETSNLWRKSLRTLSIQQTGTVTAELSYRGENVGKDFDLSREISRSCVRSLP